MAWSRACDVEDLARRFSTDYAAAFEKAEKLIAGRKELEGDDPRMFTQARFNRLMFLRFLECKGWLDFGGRTDYLRALYAAGGYRKKSFYNGRLRPLLSSSRASRSGETAKPGLRTRAVLQERALGTFCRHGPSGAGP